jgi:hypothetical protein
MSDDDRKPTFERTELVEKPAIVGAKWWQESMTAADPIARRQAVIALLGIGAAIAIGGAAVASVGGASSSSSDDTVAGTREALAMQREFGWSFGASDVPLTFDGVSQKPYDPADFDRMAQDFAPAEASHRPFATSTLFEAPHATPLHLPDGDPTPVPSLKAALRPITDTSMDAAYQAGRGVAALLDGVAAPALAVVVDLPGPLSVAFAAGLASRFDPCFGVDNWPHPRGVVAAHRTLAAAAYYQPLFRRRATERRARSPVAFVLDRSRLAPYSDDASQFDNRHVAKLPPAPSLKALGVARVLYVAPTPADVNELDDLNDTFVAWASAGLSVKMAALSDFSPDPTGASLPGPPTTPRPSSPPPAGARPPSASSPPPDAEGPPSYYGGAASRHFAFWNAYGWGPTLAPVADAPLAVSAGYSYAPRPRATAFSAASKPAGFGTVPVVLAAATGLVLGAKMSRSGSWNRASGGYSGG